MHMTVHTDCRHYRGSAPCTFHKQDGRHCHGCTDYKAIRHQTLVVKLDALGDVLRTTSILPALHARWPGTAVTWITRRNALPLLERNPMIYRALAVEDNYLENVLTSAFDVALGLDPDPLAGAILALARATEKRGFVVNHHGRAVPAGPEAETWWRMGLDDQLKRANRRTYQDLIYGICGLSGPAHRPMIPTEVLNSGLLSGWRERLGPAAGRGVLGVNTGGGLRWQYKKWTPEGYIGLIREFRRARPDVPILLLGGPEEEAFNRDLLASIGSEVYDAGCRNSLLDFCSLVSLCDALVTPDSLGFHIATALEVFAFVLVGPTSPWELEVYGKGRVVAPEMDCLACYLARCPKKPACMDLLQPSDFLADLVACFPAAGTTLET